MPRRARIHFVSLRSSLVNLPISIYGPLLERSIRPQHLAVHLILTENSRDVPSQKIGVYVGWTGMASASSLAHFNSGDTERVLETIEIDPQYATGLGLGQGDIVEIGLLHDLPTAKSVGTEPISADDWEIIEIHATHVENTLLSQVRVANIGQEINVWVLGRTRVRLRVVSLDPQSKGNALLLTTNTEVNIAPKLRSTSKSISSNKNQTSTTTTTSSPTNSTTSNAKYPSKILRVIPPHVLPLAFPPAASYTRSEALAYVSKLTFSQLVSTDTSTSSPSLPASADHNDDDDIPDRQFHKATFRRLHPPANPTDPPGNVPNAKESQPVARVFTAGGGGERKGVADTDTDTAGPKNVLVGWAEGILEKHVVFPSMVQGVDEWDLVRITATSEQEPASQLFSDSDSKTAPSHNTVTRVDPSSPTRLLAGVDDILSRCIDFCIRSFVLHASKSVVLGVSALLLTGQTGAGKTSVVQTVARILQQDPRMYTYTYYVDLARHSEQSISVLKKLFRYWFDKAAWHRPTVLIFDNMEKLLGAEVEHADSFRARHITEIFISIYSSSARFAASNTRGIILLGTAQSQVALHPLISSAHIFTDIVNIKPPNKDARKEILTHIVKRRLEMAPDIQQDTEAPLNFAVLATQTEGYSATDLQDFVARAVHQAAIKSAEKSVEGAEITLTAADFEIAQVGFVPLSLRDVQLQKSDVEWSDIGGLKDTRRVLRETLEWPTKYGPIFAKSPLRLRSGLLLYGFPGCGKTLLASAVAKECGLNFISVKGPELLNKYIGASEKSVRDLFERASAAKPCVLFFDEFDSIAPKRGHDSTGVTDRVVNQMLTQMDGAEGLDGVYVLAATSRPDLIDPALLRPGRLDKSLFCNMPNTEDRLDILQAVSRKISVAPSIDWEAIAGATEGFSGADLQALVYNAHLEVVHLSIAANPELTRTAYVEAPPVKYTVLGGPEGESVVSRAEESAIQRRLHQIHSKSRLTANKQSGVLTKPNKPIIREEDLLKVLKSTQPSVSPEEKIRLGRIYQAFVSDRSGGLPVPPSAGGIGKRASLM